MNKFSVLPVLAASILVSACEQVATEQTTNADVNTDQVIKVLHDFEDGNINGDVKFVASNGELVKSDSTALNVKFASQSNYFSSLLIKPDTPYDWSEYDDFNIAFDIANDGEHSVNIFLDVSDVHGNNYTRSVSVARGGVKTYYAKLAGHDLATPEGRGDIELNFLSGLRNNPPTWASDDIQFISLWGKKNLDTKAITQVELSVQYSLFDKEITIDNIRLRQNPPKNEDFLANTVDQFGQNATVDFADKVHSQEELIAQKKTEQAELTGELFSDRSKFGGWKNGEKQEATGYFRTGKVGDKWAFIDPEGYPYFATGLDIIRLGDAATMTGYDYDEPNDRSTRHVELQSRVDMFEWLPPLDGDLGQHYSYAGYTHSGALLKGESFNFQRANLQRKYGNNYENMWLDTTVRRMMNWGFTSLGNWTSPKLYDNNKVPYFANGWITGDYKTVSSGQDFWGALPDVFDPVFAASADATVQRVAQEVQDNPWCVGVFIDNEKSFGRSETRASKLGIILTTLPKNGAEVPTKAHFTQMMKAKYKTIEALNKAWDKDIASWEAFDAGIDSTMTTEALDKDYGDMLYAFANQYFRIVNEAMEKHMPNHLYLGARFPVWGMPEEVVEASSKHVDVISFNVYKEGIIPRQWAFLQDLDMPAIIGEFHMGAMDNRMFHPGIIMASDQDDRAKMFKDYMYSVIDNPNYIGAHYFQYADGPLTGRVYDGENYNIGFISVTDTPYAEMVNAAKEMNTELYQRRFK
ncbi:beta-galactosidase [Agaribacter marinus]|uniref:Hydrolase n=1 Tax=Agaribacter marinus TaxID=1431249 RepID=A0AA37SZZ9_9ALTE|nr:beta-galactosidase [Agaribacter marinus]GLR71160.1 hydrolase [Agaribacter marinus]